MLGSKRLLRRKKRVYLREKIAQASKGKLSDAQLRHLKCSGVSVPTSQFSLKKGWIAFEKRLRKVIDRLKSSVIIEILQLLTSLTVIVSLTFWISGIHDRWENEIFSTWQIIQQANGDRSGVTRLAVERLSRNNFSLRGIHLAETSLLGANLKNADFSEADLQHVYFTASNLQGASLWSANLQDALLFKTDLRHANLQNAKLQHSMLWQTNFQGADLQEANLTDAFLWGVNFQDTNLQYTDLRPIASHNQSNLKNECLEKIDSFKNNVSIGIVIENPELLSSCTNVWKGAVYNDFTVAHPPENGFDFKAAGMIHFSELSKQELCEYDWYMKKNDCPEQVQSLKHTASKTFTYLIRTFGLSNKISTQPNSRKFIITPNQMPKKH